MEYKIILRDKPPFPWDNSIIKVVQKNGDPFDVDNDLITFSSIIALRNYPEFLNRVAEGKGYRFFETGVVNIGPREDNIWDGIPALPEGEVEIGGNGSYLILTLNEFLKYCSQFGHKALEGVELFDLINNNLVNSEWVNSIKTSLSIIDCKIKTGEEKP